MIDAIVMLVLMTAPYLVGCVLSVQGAAHRLPPTRGLDEAVRFLQGPHFIPAESEPAQIEFNSRPPGLHFRFATPRPCSLAENNAVYGRLYRCRER